MRLWSESCSFVNGCMHLWTTMYVPTFARFAAPNTAPKATGSGLFSASRQHAEKLLVGYVVPRRMLTF